MKLSIRLHQSKDSDIISLLTNIPERYRSEAVRIAIRKLFGLPLKEMNPLNRFFESPKPTPTIPKEAPKEIRTPQKETLPSGRATTDWRTRFQQRHQNDSKPDTPSHTL